MRLLRSSTENSTLSPADSVLYTHAHLTHMQVVYMQKSLSSDKLAAMASARPIQSAPASLKAAIWQHFGFYEVEGKMDKTYTVCKVCGIQIKYFRNTKNLRSHISRYHPELTEKREPVPDNSQRTIDQAVQLPPNSERAKRITKSIARFIAMNLRPYSVVENIGFRGMVGTLEPRYRIPSRQYFTDSNTNAVQ